jgi:hypothetical protein
VLLDRRVGTRLYLRVSGPVTPKLEVEQVETSYHGAANPLDGSVDVSYTVRNTGNVRLAAHQKVEVNDLFGTAATRRPTDLAEILPGNAVTFREHFTGVAATVRVSSDVTLTPYTSASDVEAPAAFTRGDSGWAIPWALIALITVLLVAAWAVARWRRRQRSPEYRPRPATA